MSCRDEGGSKRRNRQVCTPGGSYVDVSKHDARLMAASVQVEEWDLVFSINARGVFLSYKVNLIIIVRLEARTNHAIQYAARHMIAQGRGGRIIGLSSLAGKQGPFTRPFFDGNI